MKCILLFAVLTHAVVAADFLKVQKCCQLNETYDIDDKTCVEHTNISGLTYKFSTSTRIGSPECDDTQVRVLYDSYAYNITLKNNSLWLTSHSKPQTEVTIPATAFCVENVIVDTDDEVNSTKPRWIAKTCQPKSVCAHIPCVRKCCPDGQTLFDEGYEFGCMKHQKDLSIRFDNITDDGSATRANVSAFGVMHYDRCALFTAYSYSSSRFSALDGHMHQYFLMEEYTQDDYCVDFVKTEYTIYDKMQTFTCHDNAHFRSEQVIFIICVTVSAFLIGITLLVYLIIPSSATMVDRAHIRFVACLFMSYCLELWRALLTETHYVVCIVLASLIYFVTISIYTWMTIVFFEIWRFYRIKFSGTSLKNRFIYYSLFAWGVPFLLLILNYIYEGFEPVINSYSPHRSMADCWFYNLESEAVFYFAPVGIMMIVIIVYCIAIEINVRRITRAANSQVNTDTNDNNTGRRMKKYKAKTILHMELISTITLVWIAGFFAIVFFGVNSSITEFFDAVPGICVFVVFVLNKKTLLAVKHRFVNGPNNDEEESMSGSEVGITMRDGAQST